MRTLELVLLATLGCSRSPFEEEAQGAARTFDRSVAESKAPAVAKVEARPAEAPASGEYAIVGRSQGGRFDWPGSGLRARFSDSLRVVVDETGHDELDVRWDGTTEVHVLHAGENVITVAAPGEHVATLRKRTEARDGHFVLRDVRGALPLAPRPTIEFVGDSLSTGFGLVPSLPDGRCAFVPHENDATRTYAARFADARGLDASLVAVSSQTTRQMTAVYDHAWPERTAPPWTFTDQPLAVVVLLGTNDFFHREPDRATFVHDYRALLTSIRGHRGAAVPVVAVLSPMLSDTYPADARHRTLARKYLQTALEAARRAGDPNLYELELPEPTASEGIGCSSHPSAATHERAAKVLAHLFDTTPALQGLGASL